MRNKCLAHFSAKALLSMELIQGVKYIIRVNARLVLSDMHRVGL